MVHGTIWSKKKKKKKKKKEYINKIMEGHGLVSDTMWKLRKSNKKK